MGLVERGHTVKAIEIQTGDTISVTRLAGASESYRYPTATVGEVRVLDAGATVVLLDTDGRRIGTVAGDTPVTTV